MQKWFPTRRKKKIKAYLYQLTFTVTVKFCSAEIIYKKRTSERGETIRLLANEYTILTRQVLSALSLLQLGQPSVPSSQSHTGSACFQETRPKIK